MKIFYIISVMYLITLFLLFKKTDKKLCLLSAILYSIGLLFCYNTFIVFVIYLLGLKGSILLYSIVNFVIGTILLVITFMKNKQIQKYYFDKKKLIVILCLGIIIFLIGCFRFQNFKAISYESGDSAVHYRHALKFSEELSILDKSNSRDYVFKPFIRVMPISYINCGLLFNILSEFKSYIVFSYYNVACLMICSLIFLITIIDVFKYKKSSYVFSLFLALCYTLAFPFNNFIMGFCYLSLSMVVINLLYLTIFHFKDDFNNNVIFKIIIIFLLTFSCFYSYYLFVPVIYLALGIFYILLWKKSEINFKQMCMYGIITLIIPFIIGFCYFFVTLFIDEGVGSIAKYIGMWGYSYNNVTPMYLFILLTGYFVYNFVKKKEYDYLKLNIYIATVYTAIFLVLYILKLSDLYYFYKLFSLYWLLMILFFAPKITKFRKTFYVVLVVLLIANIFVYNYFPKDNKVAQVIERTNIYSWNTVSLIDKRIVYEKEELEILEQSEKYTDVCEYDGRFLIFGAVEKNLWYYSITDTIPVDGDVKEKMTNLNIITIRNFNIWKYLMLDYDCLIYYYEGEDVNIDKTEYEILYENEFGAIIKRIRNK